MNNKNAEAISEKAYTIYKDYIVDENENNDHLFDDQKFYEADDDQNNEINNEQTF